MQNYKLGGHSHGGNDGHPTPPPTPRLLNATYCEAQPPFRNDMCSVCISPFVENDKVTKLPCLHGFHQSCIDKWLRTAHTCPNCRCNVRRDT
jgi:hypothetical protein